MTWGLDPKRDPNEHKKKAKAFQKRHAATIKATEVKKDEENNNS